MAADILFKAECYAGAGTMKAFLRHPTPPAGGEGGEDEGEGDEMAGKGCAEGGSEEDRR